MVGRKRAEPGKTLVHPRVTERLPMPGEEASMIRTLSCRNRVEALRSLPLAKHVGHGDPVLSWQINNFIQ